MEILEKLIHRQIINPAVKIVANPPDSPGVCLNRLGLQARQLQAFKVLAVIGVKLRIIGHLGVHCSLLIEMIKPMANALALPRFGVYKKQVKLQDIDFSERE
jgi:hypothetical protein